MLHKWLKDHLHWQHLLAKPLATATRDKNNPICVASSKVAKESTMVTVVCGCCWHYCQCYSSKLLQCKHSFRCSTNPSVRTRTVDIERQKLDCLSFVMCPLLVQLIIGFFFLFLLWPFTVLIKQTRQAVRTIKQSIFLDVYD